MMKLLLSHVEPTTSLHPGSIVWKPYVLPVEWSLPGPNLPNQNLQPIFWGFWSQYIQQRSHDQTTFVWTRLACCLEPVSPMEAGISGRKQLDLLWIPTTMSTTGQQTTFVVNGAILLH
jgi:hypothetical protein